MRNIDRLLVLFLAVGIWALVLMPKQIVAHPYDTHSCQGSGYGELEGDREVYIYQLQIQCEHN